MYVQFVVFEISTEFLFIFEFNYRLILSGGELSWRPVGGGELSRRRVVPAASCPGGEMAAASRRRRVGGGELS